MDHVAGYCVINDVSEREFQAERGGTWDKGKGCDTFGPTGPWMVTKDEVPDPQNLALWCEVDGKRMQNGTTRTMIFGVQHLVSYVSHFITLHAGDVIATGTPPGVGTRDQAGAGVPARRAGDAARCRRVGGAAAAVGFDVNREILSSPILHGGGGGEADAGGGGPARNPAESVRDPCPLHHVAHGLPPRKQRGRDCKIGRGCGCLVP